MDVIEFLEKDHDKLRLELVRIKNCLAGNTARSEIKRLISFLELHESVEDEILLDRIEISAKGKMSRELVAGFEEQHKVMWKLLEQLTDTLGGRRFSATQEAFFKFCAFAESHFGYEERIFFPEVRKIIAGDILEDMGAMAQQKTARFSSAKS